MCLINVYMPTAGYTTSTEDYRECLDLLSVILSKYRDTHDILIAGDLNATLLENRNNPQDKLLKMFVRDEMLHNLSKGPHVTYSHATTSSQIDYFISTFSDAGSFYPLDNLPSNTSSHIPILLEVKVAPLRVENVEQNVKRFRKLWEKCDVHQYRGHLRDSVTLSTISSPEDIDQALQHIQDALLKAEAKTVPKKLIRLSGPKWKASPAVRDILSQRKEARLLWHKIGRPSPTHPISIRCNQLKRDLRKQQRIELAIERKSFYNNIMEEQSTSNFYRLLRRNSRNSSSTVTLVSNNEHLLHAKDQCKAFAEFYEDLAIPKDDSRFDSNYMEQISYDLQMIRKITSETEDSIPVITPDDVLLATKKLHNRKAPDESGLVSEHVKSAGSILQEPISCIFNAMLEYKYVPEAFQGGIIHPIHKKGKDPTNLSNYRGITVSSLLGKLFEHIILKKIEDSLPLKQSPLQFGFTKGLSPLMAALVLNETIIEHMERNQPVFLSFLDSQKAFDVVSHASMKCKLFEQNINHHIWSMIDEMYSALSAKVLWKNHLSCQFPILQGVRQGGILSTGLYKVYINDLLIQLEKSGIGTSIGNIYTGCPTVADDVALANKCEIAAQCALHIAEQYANRERYIIHPEKSVMIRKFIPRNYTEVFSPWTVNDAELSVSTSTTHLGITRTTSDDIATNVEDRISCARRTFYSLTSTGLHGSNGLQPTTCYKIYSTYVLPRLLYGLETFALLQKHIDRLETYHISVLRLIQSLPPRAARSITYLLLGARPLEAEIHIRALTFLGNIIRSDNQVLNDILERQTQVKGSSSKSWFSYIQKILHQYSLPDISTLQQTLPDKERWKQLVHTSVETVWNEHLIVDCHTKSTLKFCNISILTIGSVHPLWRTVENNVHDAKRAITKARFLTGTYIVQSKLSRFNQNRVDPTCQLCKVAVEDYCHTLLECGALLNYRTPYLSELQLLFSLNKNQTAWSDLGREDILQFILDVSALDERFSLQLDNEAYYRIERLSRSLCHSVHCGRTFLLELIQRGRK
ncbi:hypothetical protein FSP39_002387 [Pinctada imbricata]|uniref:Reverse transcriptase domain-containing protein n=1 Tax=Pinctada imbricata TaxID=66713 RepID=A0AA89BYL0_PINIB|nr:hypothetical protein FSP39_002387 [Pinctada imbricata]